MRNMLKPPPSPIHAEGENMSEWFCPLDGSSSPSECSSLSLPFAELAISYVDDTSESASGYCVAENQEAVQDDLSQIGGNSIRRKLMVHAFLFNV